MGRSRTELMREQLERAISHAQGEYDVDDVLDWIRDGDAQLWEFENDSFAVTMRVQYPRIVRLRVVLFAGRMTDEIVERMMEIARALGAGGLECFGRPGWERRLKKFGAKPAYTVMVKDLEN